MSKTEGELTPDLVKELKSVTGSIVLKHADRFTFAIPDISCTHTGITRWIEVKYVRQQYRELEKERSFWLQIAVMRKFHTQGVGWYFVFVGAPQILYVDVLTPDQLEDRVRKNLETNCFVDRRYGKDFTGIKNIVFNMGAPNGLRGNGA
jgi:hypothetical protein